LPAATLNCSNFKKDNNMANKPRKLISFDWAIKKILRSKANFEVLEGFLSELLFEDITISEILETESNKNAVDDKFNRLDIKVKNSKDEIVLIEIQYNRELDYLQRMLYGTSKVIIEHIKESESYSKIVKVISINILYFDLGEGNDYIYKGTTSFIGMHNHSLLKLNTGQAELYKTEKIENVYPEYYLIKVKNFDDIAKDSLDEWIYFLKNEDVKDNFQAKGLAKAKEVLDYLKCSDEERLDYENYKESLHYQASMYESTYVIGRIEGKIEGKIEGIQEGKLETAKAMLQEGLDVQLIVKITGLTEQAVLSLRKTIE
jgi:predicted transposase/invertase (TIGR01784 family)